MRLPDSMIENADPQDIAGMARSVSPEKAAAIGEALAGELDEDQLTAFAAELWAESVVPQIEAIRQRADESYTREQVRQYYADLPADEQQATFDDAFRDVLVAAFSVRAALLDESEQSVAVALAELRELIRDPFTAEAILLIFENADHIDPEYSAQMKEYGAWVMRSLGVALVPELYDPETVRSIASDHGLDVDRKAADHPPQPES